MKFTTKITIIVTILIHTNKSLTDDEHLSNYISKRILKNDIEQLNSKQRQCIILREYLKSIPSDDLYKKRNSIWDVFSEKEYFRKSFQSFLFIILRQVSNFQESNVSYINLDLFDKLVEKLQNSTNQNSDIMDLITVGFETENRKVEFLIKAYNYYQNLFVNLFYANIDNHDEKIQTLKNEANKNYKNKVTEIQNSFKKLLTAVTDLEKKKNEIKTKIELFNPETLNEHVTKYKTAILFYETLKKNTPNFQDENPELIYFEKLETKSKIMFNFVIPPDLSELFSTARSTLEEKIEIQKKIDADHIIVNYYEMVLGLNYEKSKIIFNTHQSYKNPIVMGYGAVSVTQDHPEYPNYRKFINETMNYKKNKEILKSLEKNYKSIIEKIHKKMKGLIDNYVKDSSKTEEVKFAKKYKDTFLVELKEKKKKVIDLENEINKKVIELSQLELRKNMLDSKLDSEVIIPNEVYIDLESEIQSSKNAINYNEYIAKSQLIQMMNELTTKINDCFKDNQIIPDKKDEYDSLRKEYSKFELMLKINHMENGLVILDLRNDIIEILNLQMGNILGDLQNMENGEKKCFSLPEVSFYIFRMMKTNMIFFEKPFLETMLSHYSFEKKKKFILYNYLMSHNKSYALQETKQLDKNKEQYEVQFLENFTTNFSILVSILRNTTTFSQEISSEDKTASFFKRIVKIIFSIIKIPLGIYNNVLETNVIMMNLLPLINGIILTACPFLNLIPFINGVLMDLELRIYFTFKAFIFKMFAKNINSVKSKWKEFQNNKVVLNRTDEIDYYNFDYEAIINHPKFFEKPNSLVANWDEGKVKDIEKRYEEIGQDEGFDFNVFDSSDNFYFESWFQIDVYQLRDLDYLKAHNLPVFDIVVKKII